MTVYLSDTGGHEPLRKGLPFDSDAQDGYPTQVRVTFHKGYSKRLGNVIEMAGTNVTNIRAIKMAR